MDPRSENWRSNVHWITWVGFITVSCAKVFKIWKLYWRNKHRLSSVSMFPMLDVYEDELAFDSSGPSSGYVGCNRWTWLKVPLRHKEDSGDISKLVQPKHMDYYLRRSVGWGCRIHRLHLFKGVRLPKRVSCLWH